MRMSVHQRSDSGFTPLENIDTSRQSKRTVPVYGSSLYSQTGFTIIEVIAVLVILGVLIAVAVSKSPSTGTWSLGSEAEILKTNLRFAQLKAMSDVSTNTWGINVGSGSYTLQYNGATAAISLPGESSATHSLSSGVTVTTLTTNPINFDSWGSPGANNLVITLSGGSESRTITITKKTGFIP